MATGTVHLLSISGSHLGLVALLIFAVVRGVTLWLPANWLLALSRRITPTRLAAVSTFLPVAGYACLAGAELATMRSLLMMTVGLSAIWLGQERRLFHALSAAAVGILLHDPQAVFDISFQLSFVSVFAIAGWLSWPTQTRVERKYRIAPEGRATKSPVRRQRGHGTDVAPGQAKSHSARQSSSAMSASLPVPPLPDRHSLQREGR